MIMLTNWIQTPAARALGWTLFHFLWEGIAIAAALATALLLLRAARVRYIAACLALAAMIAGCVVTFVRVLAEEARSHSPGPALLLSLTPADAGGSAENPGPRFHASDLLPWATPVWLVGVLLLHLRTTAGWMAASRLRRSGVCRAPEVWQQRLAILAAGVRLSKPILLIESCRIDVPLVVGYLRPAILMPLGLLAGMPPDHLEAILLHELAHIRRRDYLVNLLQTLAENLLFYHPAVWWISGVIRTERENCCDDLVVAVRGNAHDYAVALTALEESRWTGETVLAATGGDLMKRIHRLVDRPEPPHTALTPAFSAGLIIVIAAVTLAAWQPKPAQEPSAQTADSPYQKWLNEDVAYIISERESEAFKQLTTDEERVRFIEQFWLRRDPTPGTPENESKEEHYRRIAYANERYYAKTSRRAGWRTDRGRVYITYGPPDTIKSWPLGNQTIPFPFERWEYRHIEGVGDNITIQFTDPDRSGEYRMARDGNSFGGAQAWVSRQTIWSDSVKQGDLRRQVRGLGTLADNGVAEVRIAASQAKELSFGQTASVDLGAGAVSGRVARIDPTAVDNTVSVSIQLDAPLPATARNGQDLEATIDIEILSGVVYVGRPVSGQPNSEGVLFKIEPDGQHAVRVPVRFGRTSVNKIQILGGLQLGDRVILSDMSPYMLFDRLQLR